MIIMPSEPKWLTIARGEIGQAEIAGDQDNPRIVEYLKCVSIPPSITLHDEISWCAAFVCWCLQSAGIQSTHSAAARAYLNWGKELKSPKLGCIAVLKRGTSAWQGHAAFHLSEDLIRGRVTLLGGNQKNQVCIESFPQSDVLSNRYPL